MDPRIKNLKSETKGKEEKLRNLDNEKEQEEIIFCPIRELRQMKAASAPAVQSVENGAVVEVGVQASPEVVDTSTEPQEEALVKRKQQGKQKETEKEGANDGDKICWMLADSPFIRTS